jgi:hypothetical protein
MVHNGAQHPVFRRLAQTVLGVRTGVESNGDEEKRTHEVGCWLRKLCYSETNDYGMYEVSVLLHLVPLMRYNFSLADMIVEGRLILDGHEHFFKLLICFLIVLWFLLG